MSTYHGDIQIEDNNFELTANRFILRKNEYSFSFSGLDEFGPFEVEGVATKSEAGFYMAPRLPLNYLKESGDDTVSIKVDEVLLKKNKCNISGTWIQAGDNFIFSATLKLMKT